MKKKNYNRIRGVLDVALDGYAKAGGHFDKKGECKRIDGTTGFKHVIEFPCIKQPAGTIKEAFYALHHLKGLVRDADIMNAPPSLREWSTKIAGEINDSDLREDFHRIQVKLSQIIVKNVEHMGGLKPTRKVV